MVSGVAGNTGVSSTDADLLAATVAGDPDAFAAFFRRHERAVMRFAISRCSMPDDVADVVSETFLVALRRRPGTHADDDRDGRLAAEALRAGAADRGSR